jgi:hypothetical protein
MRKVTWLLLGASVFISFASATEYLGDYKAFRASYLIYSGEPGERAAPTATDRKLAIAIEGQPAKEIFDSMAPDFHPTCSQEKGDRDRRKGNAYCTYSPRGQGKGYRCWIGVNLRTGESVGAVSC